MQVFKRYTRIFTEIIATFFILLFLYAALTKFFDYRNFQIQLQQSPLLTVFSEWIAFLIPSLEIMIVLLLSFGRSRLSGLYLSYSLMVLFTAYIIAITQFSDYIPCSCGGVLQSMNWNQHLIFNLCCMALALAGILFMDHDGTSIAIEPGEAENLSKE